MFDSRQVKRSPQGYTLPKAVGYIAPCYFGNFFVVDFRPTFGTAVDAIIRWWNFDWTTIEPRINLSINVGMRFHRLMLAETATQKLLQPTTIEIFCGEGWTNFWYCSNQKIVKFRFNILSSPWTMNQWANIKCWNEISPILWLQILQHQKLVQFTTTLLTAWLERWLEVTCCEIQMLVQASMSVVCWIPLYIEVFVRLAIVING